jgi:hypothetical protein
MTHAIGMCFVLLFLFCYASCDDKFRMNAPPPLLLRLAFFSRHQMLSFTIVFVVICVLLRE